MNNTDDLCQGGLIALLAGELLMLQLGSMSRLKFEGGLPELGPLLMSMSGPAFMYLLMASLIGLICGVTLMFLWIRMNAKPTFFSVSTIVVAALLWLPAVGSILNFGM